MDATSATRGATVGDAGSPHEQAEQKLYTDENGTPIVPGPNLFRCLIDAGKFFKLGRSKVTTRETSLIPACVELEELIIPIEHEESWSVDTRPVRIPSTGGRILRYRPRFDDWKLSFTLTLDTDIMAAKLLREIVDDAGRKIGLGDFRIDHKGPFGKFVVTKWENGK